MTGISPLYVCVERNGCVSTVNTSVGRKVVVVVQGLLIY